MSAGAKALRRHLSHPDPYVGGWGRTACGRKIGEGRGAIPEKRVLDGADNMDADGLCETCRTFRDFGILAR